MQKALKKSFIRQNLNKAILFCLSFCLLFSSFFVVKNKKDVFAYSSYTNKQVVDMANIQPDTHIMSLDCYLAWDVFQFFKNLNLKDYFGIIPFNEGFYPTAFCLWYTVGLVNDLDTFISNHSRETLFSYDEYGSPYPESVDDFEAYSNKNLDDFSFWSESVYTVAYVFESSITDEDFNIHTFSVLGKLNKISFILPVPLPDDPVADGYTFAGWYYDSNLTQAYDGAPVYEDTALYAGWRISYEPSQQHYNFDGWYLDESLTIPYDNEVISLETPKYPKWNHKKYIVNFVSNYSLGVKSITLDSLTAYTPDSISRAGYNFLGWFIDSDLSQQYINGTELTGSLTLYAKWEVIMVKVTFYNGNEVYQEIEVPWGSSLIYIQRALQTKYGRTVAIYEDEAKTNEVNYTNTVQADSELVVEFGEEIKPETNFDKAIDWIKSNYMYFIYGFIGLVVVLLIIKVIKKVR